MENAGESAGEQRTLVIRLCGDDFAILEKFRGDLSPEAFFSALLRMIDSGAVMNKPEWVRQKEEE
jgi:hypothetical protein